MKETTMSDTNETADARKDVDSVESDDTASDVESKVLGLDDLTGVPSDTAADAQDAPHPEGN